MKLLGLRKFHHVNVFSQTAKFIFMHWREQLTTVQKRKLKVYLEMLAKMLESRIKFEEEMMVSYSMRHQKTHMRRIINKQKADFNRCNKLLYLLRFY